MSGPIEGVDYVVINGKQYTIPPKPKRMTNSMRRKITLMRSLLRQIIRADDKRQMMKCHKLSKKLSSLGMKVESHYWFLAPKEIAGWTEIDD